VSAAIERVRDVVSSAVTVPVTAQRVLVNLQLDATSIISLLELWYQRALSSVPSQATAGALSIDPHAEVSIAAAATAGKNGLGR
jgi:hypothetical protein